MSLTNDLRISLPFNGDWLDKSGNNNDVTPSNILLKTDTPKIGSGYAWGDGVDDDGEIADSTSLDVDYITVAVWFKHTINGITILYERSNGTYGADDWDLITFGHRLRFQLHIGGALRDVDCTTFINDGNWHLAVFSYDGAYLRVFIDNVYEAETATPHGAIGASSDPLTIFARKGKIVPYPGSQDSFLMWGRALTFGGVSIGQQAIGEVAQVWNGGAGVELPTPFVGVGGIPRSRIINLGGV